MAFKTLHTVVAVVGIALTAAGAWWWQHRDAPGAVPAASSGAGPAATAGGGPGGAAGGAPGGVPGGAPGARPGGPSGGGAPGGGPRGPAAVEVGKVQAVRLVDDAQAVGSLRSLQSVVVRPEVSGRVMRIGFQDGRSVQKGQLLLQLDDTLQQAQMQQAQAQASIARTNLQRSRELLSQGFVSQSAVDQNAAAVEVAEAQVALARAQLGRMRVLAPFNGVTGIKQISVGDYLKDGADVVSLEDVSAMLVDFRLPERYIAQMRPGLAVEITVDALGGATFAGRVEALDAQVDANGRSLLVRARVDNPGSRLKSGMFVRPRVVFAQRDNALVVPEEALVPQGGKQFLFKVVPGEGGQRVARRIEARIGVRQPGRVEILEGLQAGDQVVTAGHTRLRGESTPVRVIDLDNPSAGRPAGAGVPPGATPGASPNPAAAPSPAASGPRPARPGNGTAP
jgi:membrane fusion protein (multidrug efflux system)